MFTSTELFVRETIGALTPLGLVLLWALRVIDAPVKAGRLALLITGKPDTRQVKPALDLLELGSYVSHTGTPGHETWYLTDRGRQLPLPLVPATGYLLASQTSASDESGSTGMVSQSGAIEQTTSAGTSGSVIPENGASSPDMGNLRAARNPSLSSSLSGSDLISDQILEERETDDARRARCVDLTKVLDAYGVDDNPPRRYRSRLLADPFVTADRFRAALLAAQSNPRRTSAVPTGLAISEVLNRKTRHKYAVAQPASSAAEVLPAVQGTPAGYTHLLHDPVFDQIVLNLAQHYGDLFLTINPRLVASDERPNKFTVLVALDRSELKAMIARLAAGYSRKSYSVQIVTAWPGITSGDTQPETAQRIAALKVAYQTVVAGPVYLDDVEEQAALKWLAEQGCTAERLTDVYRRLKAQDFWKHKPVRVKTLAKNFGQPTDAAPANRSSISRYTTVRASS